MINGTIDKVRTRLLVSVAFEAAVALICTGGCAAQTSQSGSASVPRPTHIVVSVPQTTTNDVSQSWSSLAHRIEETARNRGKSKNDIRFALSQEQSLHDQATHLRTLAQNSAKPQPQDDLQAEHLGHNDLLLFAPAVHWQAGSIFTPLVSPTKVPSSLACTTQKSSQTQDNSSSTSTKTGRIKQQKAAKEQNQQQNRNSELLAITQDSSCSQIAADVSTISSSLATLKKNHVAVVAIGTMIGTTPPDLLIRTPNPYEIGEKEASHLVDKIQLQKSTDSTPQGVLLLLPSSDRLVPQLRGTNAGQSQTRLPVATHEYLRGALHVLKPYFTNGSAYNAFDISLTEANDPEWTHLLVSPDSPDADTTVQQIFDTCRKQILSISHTGNSGGGPLDQNHLLGRLSHIVLGTGDTIPLSGIVAGNDSVADLTVSELKSRGYAGSASDINPEVTLGGILTTIGRSPDLSKKKVPSPTISGDASSSVSARMWPVVIGFGARGKNASYVTTGQQWATGIVDEKKLATIVTRVIANVAHHDTLFKDIKTHAEKMTYTSKPRSIRVVQTPLLFADDTNLKLLLVDGGYISAADAGI